MGLSEARQGVRSILRALQYQLAHAVWCIEHGHVPDVRQFECGPRLVALAVCQGLIKVSLWKFWEADVCLLRHLLERAGNLDRLETAADLMCSNSRLRERPLSC